MILWNLNRSVLCSFTIAVFLLGCNGESVPAPEMAAEESASVSQFKDELLVFEEAYLSSSDAVTDFLVSLPEFDEELPLPEETQGDDYWQAFLGPKTPLVEFFLLQKSFAPQHIDYLPPPNIDPMLKRDLVLDGVKIIEARDKRANRRVGIATCRNGTPIIIYSKKHDKRISPYAFVFFREHEYAHHKLKHVRCGLDSRTNYPTQPQDEINADCEAKKTLLTFDDGLRIVDRTWQQFWDLNLPSANTHPSTRTRADSLETCE